MKLLSFLFACFLLSFCAGAQGIVTDIAGNGIAGYGIDGIPATQSSLSSRAEKVVIAKNGDLYIADSNRIRKVDAVTGIISTFAGSAAGGFGGDGGLATDATFHNITYLSFSPGCNNLYVCDNYNNRIRKIDMQTNIVSTVAGNGHSGFSGDGGPAVDAEMKGPTSVFSTWDYGDDMFISDYGNNRVRWVNAVGNISTFAGTGASANFGDSTLATTAGVYRVGALTVNKSSTVYLECGDANRVRIISCANLWIYKYAGTGNAPSNGDGGDPRLANVTNTGDVAVDDDYNMYIPERSTHTIRKVSDGPFVINTIAGTGVAGYNGNNVPADMAMFNKPRKVTVDSCGNLFVTDGGNARIRRITYTECHDYGLAAGTVEKRSAGVTVYPNPASTELTIRSGDKMPSVTIVDVTGKVLLQRTVNSEQVTVDARALVPGVYFVKVGDKVVKFVRE